MARYRNGLRVRVGGPHGPRGVLRRCTARDGHEFWRVLLAGGAWVWPDRIVVDGPGPHVLTCGECAIAYLSADPTALLCPTCDVAIFGPADREIVAERVDRWERRLRRERKD